MTFIPRLGAPVRHIASYSSAAVAHGSAAEASALAAATAGATHVRGIPPLMFAVTCVDNSVVLLNGSTLTAVWRSSGLAVSGLPALLPLGLQSYFARAAYKSREKALKAAALAGNTALVARFKAQSAPGGSSRLFPTGVLPSALHATGRQLLSGIAVDPRTGAVVTNGFPGRGTLQWYDARRGGAALRTMARVVGQ